MNAPSSIHEICLEVFAGVSAIVTHEIRNALAIINESAGFLDDLAQMSGEDGEVPSGRVKQMATSVCAQVDRANRLMKNLNTFAHSGDVPVSRLDIKETLELMTALTKRKAAARQVTVSLESPDNLHITTHAFAIEALIYLYLIGIYESVPQKSRIHISATQNGEQRISLKFTLEGDEELLVDKLQDSKSDALLKALRADFEGGLRTIQVHLESLPVDSVVDRTS
ncbi:hypothetical protein [Desulfosediminicola flagellatus]|uniref:hypothetical protein n=1 Tax=Desulfosediminicola flagellatus TaxID=2569541 RepID=UPI0010AB5FD0|nr:hypothetical protein [Desulfosediminicola flagellatus]